MDIYGYLHMPRLWSDDQSSRPSPSGTAVSPTVQVTSWLSSGRGESVGNGPDEPTDADSFSETLRRRLDSLDLVELKAVRSYVDRRIEGVRPPLAEEIEATAAGEVLKIDTHGAYALVRKHPPDPDGSGVATDVVSLYHVRREPHLDGTESLHWTYLGDVYNAEQTRCESCGGAIDGSASVCPHCGRDHSETPGTEE